MDKKAELWDFMVDREIASERTLEVIVSINGYSLKTLYDVLFATTGYRNQEQENHELWSFITDYRKTENELEDRWLLVLRGHDRRQVCKSCDESNEWCENCLNKTIEEQFQELLSE